jgi:tRNA pseudouridine38-40 synthase
MRYFIHLSYLGTKYHGWQIQPNASTVQEVIEDALSTILSNEVSIMGCGRTDTGVHALNFYAHFDFESSFDIEKLKVKLNGYLDSDIAIHDIIKVQKDQHVRFDAVKRSYIYKMHSEKNVFLHNRSYLFSRKLAYGDMRKAALVLKQYKDFSCFSKSNTQTKTNLCSIYDSKWVVSDHTCEFHITADRFLRGMVRAIVGTLIEVGEGKRTVEEFHNIIKSKDRSKAGPSAPAHGLYLSNVKYDFI